MTREEAIAYGKRVIELGLNDETQAFCKLAILALSAEPCREADDYENEIADLHNRLDIAEYDKERYKEEITTLEAENKGEDRPKGHWIESGYVGNDNYLFECSECHHTDTQSKAVKVNYCWYCGADMREGVSE